MNLEISRVAAFPETWPKLLHKLPFVNVVHIKLALSQAAPHSLFFLKLVGEGTNLRMHHWQ